MELNAEEIKRLLAEYEVVCDNCACNDGDEIGKKIMLNALALINSQEQRIGAQDMTISELRKRVEKAEHDADRYAQRIKELTNDVEDWKALAEQYHNQLVACNKEKAKLTEENERLKAQKYMIHPDGKIEMIPTIESVRADTIEKMLDIMEQNATNSYPRRVRLDVMVRKANELLEEG